ncbi:MULTISPECIES: hypothetical protein [Moorena]|nr:MULTISPECIES: hypothetical protein [Moorena]NEP32225.1 hypothetical protein [Moorena sp. SIO3B2]NEP66178.1 hypothetical protein [Moorena sp. SIO3A5]NEQ05059.1 hypothetical protein [Moorena sp. SIO4E2]
MTRLLIQTQTVPVMVNLPGIIPMTPAQFSEFCLANRDLRIERTASGLGKSAGLLPLRPQRTVRTSLQVHGATDSF